MFTILSPCLFNSEIQCRHISLKLMAQFVLSTFIQDSDWWDILVFQLCKLQGIGNVSLSFLSFFFFCSRWGACPWNWSCWLHKSCCASFRVVFSARLNRCVCVFFSLQPIARRRSRYKSLLLLLFSIVNTIFGQLWIARYRTGSLSRCKRNFGRKLLAPPLSYFFFF